MSFPVFTLFDAIDIAIVTLLVYYVILFVRGTRAVAALNGIFVLFIIYIIAQAMGLYTLVWIFENIFSSLFLVIVVLFHEDIRQALSTLSIRSFFKPKQIYNKSVAEVLASSCFSLAQKNIGALIILEQKISLGDFAEKAVNIDANLSEDLLGTIFYPQTPLHDGAVIIDTQGRIKAAGCILPLASVERQHFGTRHRAALGLSEVSDALAIVVSEERGEVTIAIKGTLSEPLSQAQFIRTIKNVIHE